MVNKSPKSSALVHFCMQNILLWFSFFYAQPANAVFWGGGMSPNGYTAYMPMWTIKLHCLPRIWCSLSPSFLPESKNGHKGNKQSCHNSSIICPKSHKFCNKTGNSCCSGAQQAKKGLGAKNDSALYFWKRGKTGDSGQKKETREDNGCLL